MPLLTPATALELDKIGARLLADAEVIIAQRQCMDLDFVSDHRQYIAEYSPDELRKIRAQGDGACELFVGITRTKVRTLDAWIAEMRGAAQKNWMVEPTPVPDVDPEKLAAAMQLNAQLPPDQQKPQFLVRDEVARACADLMDTQMYDDYVESNLDDINNFVCHSGHQYGVGILKGPLVSFKSAKRWGATSIQDQFGNSIRQYKMAQATEIKPYFEHVSVFDLYLDWAAKRPQDSERFIQRHLFTKRRLTMLAKDQNFYGDRISTWITDKPDGESRWESWEEKELYVAGREKPLIDKASRRRYELLEDWVALTADELKSIGMEETMKAWGYDVTEATASLIQCHVWYRRTDGQVLGITLNPNEDGKAPYKFYVPIPEEGSIYGVSVGRMMKDQQQSMNSSNRMMHDNGAVSVKPQAEVRIQRIIDPADLQRLTPGRMTAVTETSYNASMPAITYTDLPNHTALYLQMFSFVKSLTDDVVGIPSYQSGSNSPGAGRTASGLSMLMGAAGKLVRDLLRAYDRYDTSVLQALFDFEMQYSPNQDIKGDCYVKVTSTTSMLNKAQYVEMMKGALQLAASPQIAPWVKIPDLVRELFKNMDLDPKRFVKTKADMLAEMNTPKPPPDPVEVTATLLGLEEKRAKIIGMLAKASADRSKGGAVTDVTPYIDELRWLDQEAMAAMSGMGGQPPSAGTTPPAGPPMSGSPQGPAQTGPGDLPPQPPAAAHGGEVSASDAHHLYELHNKFPDIFQAVN